jgi:hypothetical protein
MIYPKSLLRAQWRGFLACSACQMVFVDFEKQSLQKVFPIFCWLCSPGYNLWMFL